VSTPLEATQETLTAYAKYGKGWDGYHADPMSLASAAEAIVFVEREGLTEPPQVSLSGDGEVSLIIGDTIYDFVGDGTMAVSVRNEDGHWHFCGFQELPHDPRPR
jgi:hypothetical protein